MVLLLPNHLVSLYHAEVAIATPYYDILFYGLEAANAKLFFEIKNLAQFQFLIICPPLINLCETQGVNALSIQPFYLKYRLIYQNTLKKQLALLNRKYQDLLVFNLG